MRYATTPTGNQGRRHGLGWVASRLGLPVIAAAVCTAAITQAAYADDGGSAAAPPSSATAAPATAFADTTGDGGDYTASDGCHYYPSGGQWFSDLCFRPVAGSDGNPVAGRTGAFANLGDGHLGQELLEIDNNDPNETALRVPTNPLFATVAWVRSPRTDPTGPGDAMVYDHNTATWVWLPISTLRDTIQSGGGARYGFATSATTPTPDVETQPTTSRLSPEGQAEIAQMQMNLANSNAHMLQVWTEPACDSSFNGCR